MSTKATPPEIEHAYHKMIKESHFNRSLKRKDIELAYLILTDVAEKAMHDAVIAHDEKEMEITAKIQKRKEKKITTRNLVPIALGLFVFAIFFFFFRFGYQLKTFSPGDVVYYKDSHRLLGTIVEVQNNHDFGKVKKDAYKIKDSNGHFQWFPENDVKISCYKK